jgi:hypothetical protein
MAHLPKGNSRVKSFKQIREEMMPSVKTPTVQQLAKKYGVDVAEVEDKLEDGIEHEMEHTTNKKLAREIALDHLGERLDYYDELEDMEDEDEDEDEDEKKKVKEETDSRLKSAGVSGYNKPKATPSHPKKSHIVVAKSGDQVKTIRFGEQGAETAGDPKKGESERMKKKRASFKARHAKNIKKGKMSAAYWADKVKW